VDAPPTKRPRSRVRRLVGNGLGGILLLCLLYAWLYEPYRLEVSHHVVPAPVSAPLKIAHLTDLHTQRMGRRELRVLESLESEKPDLIAITGDTVDQGDWEKARPLLQKMHAPLGVWLVDGNWEHWRPAHDKNGLFAATSVRRLTDEWARAREDLSIVGFDDALAGVPDPTRALKDLPRDRCALVLFHSPVFFDTIADRLPPCAIALAGHTHGGQVRLPLLGPLWIPPGSGSYLAGWYSRANARMYVSRGIGTSILDVRFLCRPELAYITLVPG
jgi:predicted MPP superfamily phosphohydrolase